MNAEAIINETRIPLTSELRQRLREAKGDKTYEGYTKEIGMPYRTFESLVTGERKTISIEQYVKIMRPTGALDDVPESALESEIIQYERECNLGPDAREVRRKLFTNFLKSIPYNPKDKSVTEMHRYTEVDKTAEKLGMPKGIFDLLVWENTEFLRGIFIQPYRTNGNYRWHTPNMLIESLNQNSNFNKIKEEYEIYAKYRNTT